MGLNTAAIILNDHLHELQNAPDAGAQIARAIQLGHRGKGWTNVGVTVLPSVHADAVQVVAIGGNAIRNLGYGHWRDDDEKLLRKLADDMGFRLVRKAKAAVPQ
jgi:hypothetical protein